MNPKKSNTFVFLLFILCLAFGIRLTYLLNYSKPDKYGLGSPGDSITYHNIAVNLYQGHGFTATPSPGCFGYDQNNEPIEYLPYMSRGPVYPYYLAKLYSLFTINDPPKQLLEWRAVWFKVKIVQCVLNSLVCLFIFLIIRRILPKREGVALTGALLYCFSLSGIYFSTVLLTENITTFLLTLFTYFFISGLKTKKQIYFLLSSFSFAILVLGRKEYILFSALLLVYLLIIFRGHQDRQKALAIWITHFLCLILLILPWTLRNYMHSNKLIPISTDSVGLVLFYGTFQTKDNIDLFSQFDHSVLETEEEKAMVFPLSRMILQNMYTGSLESIKFNNYLKALAVKRIRRNPRKVILNWLKKIPLLWDQSILVKHNFPFLSNSFSLTPFYFFTALASLWNLRYKNRIYFMFLFLLFAYINILFFPSYIEPRYGIPLIPIILILSAFGIGNIFNAINYLYKNPWLADKKIQP